MLDDLLDPRQTHPIRLAGAQRSPEAIWHNRRKSAGHSVRNTREQATKRHGYSASLETARGTRFVRQIAAARRCPESHQCSPGADEIGNMKSHDRPGAATPSCLEMRQFQPTGDAVEMHDGRLDVIEQIVPATRFKSVDR